MAGHPLQVGEVLPPLNRDGASGQAFNQYLRRRKLWMSPAGRRQAQG